mmetsp:Transcript_23268/g.36277  ORF Transcript_23268/g.36277 Transcript_23268/m.36277 type:complete len:101 (-) Transcript_23268:26-328(-)|eukprot:CAMPEP_0201524244 /NCGR_PEP_ID=MMETSP0161_2-20130828/21196_1 /ASSEMBLY_ACC=CAM_ASM_000251 /TAXON_ID=180227 /ORGANISM="Neoparamoeba aestuarina, Strain SoJaBio B1-5/56/2" /LENGTH=100 /DNA_ID=CAMNT_0047923541 /DNA_START=411 /DNA_END=713 /DNA_ORIENTATION=-
MEEFFSFTFDYFGSITLVRPSDDEAIVLSTARAMLNVRLRNLLQITAHPSSDHSTNLYFHQKTSVTAPFWLVSSVVEQAQQAHTTSLERMADCGKKNKRK